MAPARPKLGDVLVRSKLITESQLTEALNEQKAQDRLLGEILIDKQWLTEYDVARAVAEQYGLIFVADLHFAPDFSRAHLMDPVVARMLGVLPYGARGDTVLLAMADPWNWQVTDTLPRRLGKPYELIVCTRKALERGLKDYARWHEAQLSGGRIIQEREATKPEADPLDGGVDTRQAKEVESIIDEALSLGASDIHVEPGETHYRVRYRVDGFLQGRPARPMETHAGIVSRMKVLANLDISERRLPQDGRIELRGTHNVDLRVSTLPTVYGEKVVMRVFDRSRKLPPVEELGFPAEVLEHYLKCAQRPHGMLLVTGPTGSGKTSTLMSTLSHVNTPDKNIVTIEDPVEYKLPGINHVQIHPKAGLNFADGLRSILRQDPNIIMVGEIRDGETADVAVRAALTGHLVLSTLHTNDAPGALTRLTDMGVEPYLIASSVLGVLAQRLVRRVCKYCRQPYRADAEPFREWGCTVPPGDTEVTLYKAIGCARCGDSGYAGRFPIVEFLRMSTTIQNMVVARSSSYEIREQALADGMKLLMTHGLQMALQGETTADEVMRLATSRDAH